MVQFEVTHGTSYLRSSALTLPGLYILLYISPLGGKLHRVILKNKSGGDVIFLSFFLLLKSCVLDALSLQEKPEPGRANIYQSVVINSSKEMIAFSDFPPPAELPNHMHHSEVLLYMRLYAQAFQLLPHLRFQVSVSQADDPVRQCSYSWKRANCVCFQTTVVSVRRASDFDSTGRWEVETESSGGQKETWVFDAVIICTGHFTRPHLPLKDFPGTSKRTAELTTQRAEMGSPLAYGDQLNFKGLMCNHHMLQTVPLLAVCSIHN